MTKLTIAAKEIISWKKRIAIARKFGAIFILKDPYVFGYDDHFYPPVEIVPRDPSAQPKTANYC